jgi:hypothetical protein
MGKHLHPTVLELGYVLTKVNAIAFPGQQGVIEILEKCPVQDEKPEGFKIYSATIQSVNGVRKIYLVFTGGDGDLFIISNFRFLS